MKSCELVRLLLTADPTGGMECSVDGIDIYTVSRSSEPAETIEFGQDGRVLSAYVDEEQEKVLLRTLSLKSALLENPGIPVITTSIQAQDAIEEYRQQACNILRQTAKEDFVTYIRARVHGLREHTRYLVEDFYDEYLDWRDPLPPDLLRKEGSIQERRWEQWDREIEIDTNTKGDIQDLRLIVGMSSAIIDGE